DSSLQAPRNARVAGARARRAKAVRPLTELRFVFVTSRPEKGEEAGRLGFRIERVDVDLPDPQALDPEVVALEKVHHAWERLRRPVLVEDSGLEILAWNGFPGALVKWLEKSAGLETIVRMLGPFSDRRARAVCAIAGFDGERLWTARGVTEGEIAPVPRGAGGFGWDPIQVHPVRHVPRRGVGRGDGSRASMSRPRAAGF